MEGHALLVDPLGVAFALAIAIAAAATPATTTAATAGTGFSIAGETGYGSGVQDFGLALVLVVAVIVVSRGGAAWIREVGDAAGVDNFRFGVGGTIICMRVRNGGGMALVGGCGTGASLARENLGQRLNQLIFAQAAAIGDVVLTSELAQILDAQGRQ